MASFIKVGDKTRVQIRRKGHKTITKTFTKENEAKTWAKRKEAEIETGIISPSSGKTGDKLSSIITKYEDERKELGNTSINVLKHLRNGLGDKILDQLTSKDIVDYVTGRRYGPATAAVELSNLGTVLKFAKVAWGYSVPNVMEDARLALKMLGRVGKSNERDRRPTQKELDDICKWFDSHSKLPMRDLIWFSVYSTFRSSEVTKIRWSDYDAKHRTIKLKRKDPDQQRKNQTQEVPVPDEAAEILERQPRYNKGPEFEGDEKWDLIFPFDNKTFSNLFPRACQSLGIEDLHWHDLRHEGISRLFEIGYEIVRVAQVSGHKDWKHLKRYTQLKAKDWPRLSGKKRNEKSGIDPAEVENLAQEKAKKMLAEMIANMGKQTA